MNLKNKIIVLTGGTSGIGKALASTLEEHGSKVIILARNRSRLLKMKKNKMGGKNFTYRLDLASYVQISQAAKKILSEHRRIDWLINCAGTINSAKKIEESSRQEITDTFNVNTLAPIYLIQKLLPSIKKNGGILNIVSTAGLEANGRFPLYSASKAGLISFSQAVNKRFLFDEPRRNLRCLTICPGPTNTPMRDRIAGDARQHQEPSLVADYIVKIINSPTVYKGDKIIVIQKGKVRLR